MREESGIVIQRDNGTVVVLTPNGEIRRVSVRYQAQVGEEVLLSSGAPRFSWAWAAVAAVLVVAILMGWHGFFPAPIHAYVALDINPSVEMGFDKAFSLVWWQGLDEEGALLTRPLSRGMGLGQAMDGLIEEAVDLEYLRPGDEGENVLLVSWAFPGGQSGALEEEMERSVSDTLSANGIEGKIGASQVSMETWEDAQALGLSPNRLLLLKAAEAEGIHLEPSDLQGPVSRILKQIHAHPGEVFGKRPSQVPVRPGKDDGETEHGPGRPEDKKPGPPFTPPGKQGVRGGGGGDDE
ncbi:MAG: anti-sigma factor domain-containing protein [Bacillota bacterium]